MFVGTVMCQTTCRTIPELRLFQSVFHCFACDVAEIGSVTAETNRIHRKTALFVATKPWFVIAAENLFALMFVIAS